MSGIPDRNDSTDRKEKSRASQSGEPVYFSPLRNTEALCGVMIKIPFMQKTHSFVKAAVSRSDRNTDTETNPDSMYQMFQNCTSITGISRLADWNAGNVTDMQDIFQNCTCLMDTAGLAGWNTCNKAVVVKKFESCKSVAGFRKYTKNRSGTDAGTAGRRQERSAVSGTDKPDGTANGN